MIKGSASLVSRTASASATKSSLGRPSCICRNSGAKAASCSSATSGSCHPDSSSGWTPSWRISQPYEVGMLGSILRYCASQRFIVCRRPTGNTLPAIPLSIGLHVFTDNLDKLVHASLIGMFSQRALLTRPGDGLTLRVMLQVIPDQLGAFLRCPIGDDLLAHLKHLGQVFFPVGQEKSANTCRLEQAHVVGKALGGIDMSVQADFGL